MTQNTDFIRLYRNFDRFTLLIVSMIKSINHSFFQSLIRIIKIPERKFAIFLFDYSLLDHICFEISQGVLNHLGYRTFNRREFNDSVGILFATIRENHYFNSWNREKFLGFFTKHHGRNIFDGSIFYRAIKKVHLFQNLIHFGRFESSTKFTIHFAKIVIYKNWRNIGNSYICITPFVKGNATGHIP